MMNETGEVATVIAVHRSSSHSFSKFTEDGIALLQGLGIQGDAHCGHTVKHRSRVARDAIQPNLRQVHLLHMELFDGLIAAGHAVWPGELGENITTRGLDLLGLPTGTRLALGGSAVVEVTGLRSRSAPGGKPSKLTVRRFPARRAGRFRCRPVDAGMLGV